MEAKQDHSDVPVKHQELQCPIDGCEQSFPLDGNCSVHMTKKYDLSLNLQMPQKGPGGAGLFADQTPTPTRLIGKCEEVGLFEDLQNVNPFDETFRRAVESGASSISSLTDDQSPQIPQLSVPFFRAAEGETLHTPHIFPSGIDRSTLLERVEVGGGDSVDAGESATVSKQPRLKGKAGGAHTRGKQQQEEQGPAITTSSVCARNEPKTPKKTPIKRKTLATLVDILPKPSSPPVTQPSALAHPSIPLIIIPSDPSPTKLVPVEGNIMVKEKLKEHLAKVRDTPPLPPKNPSPQAGKKREKRTEDKPEAANKVAKLDLPKQVKERWKDASKRYRVRQKKDQDELRQRNKELEDEVLQLRTQLTALRNAHRNCNVTRNQNAAKLVQGTAQGVAIGGRGSVQQEAILLNTIEQQQPVLVLQEQQEQPQPQLQQEQPAPVMMPTQRLITSHLIDSMHQLQPSEPPAPMSITQQRLITSQIIDTNRFNRMPIIIVVGQGGSPHTVVPVAHGSALEEGNG